MFARKMGFILVGLLWCGQCKKGTDPAPHWGYSGDHGPDHWGQLAADFQACATGGLQSPIDIEEPLETISEPLVIRYTPAPLEVVNNGHTIQANLPDGSTLQHKGKLFKLIQFHFHTPSENRIRGKAFPMELHMVHKGDAGQLYVIGVLMAEGKENEILTSIWKNLPGPDGKVSIESLDPANLLPTRRDYYSFTGSLTTPPCSEGVNWLVMAEATWVSRRQIDSFRSLFPGNARPPQKRAHRAIHFSEG